MELVQDTGEVGRQKGGHFMSPARLTADSEKG